MTFSLDPEWISGLDRIAEETNRSRSSVAGAAIEAFVASMGGRAVGATRKIMEVYIAGGRSA